IDDMAVPPRGGGADRGGHNYVVRARPLPPPSLPELHVVDIAGGREHGSDRRWGRPRAPGMGATVSEAGQAHRRGDVGGDGGGVLATRVSGSRGGRPQCICHRDELLRGWMAVYLAGADRPDRGGPLPTPDTARTHLDRPGDGLRPSLLAPTVAPRGGVAGRYRGLRQPDPHPLRGRRGRVGGPCRRQRTGYDPRGLSARARNAAISARVTGTSGQ